MKGQNCSLLMNVKQSSCDVALRQSVKSLLILWQSSNRIYTTAVQVYTNLDIWNHSFYVKRLFSFVYPDFLVFLKKVHQDSHLKRQYNRKTTKPLPNCPSADIRAQFSSVLSSPSFNDNTFCFLTLQKTNFVVVIAIFPFSIIWQLHRNKIMVCFGS